MLWSAVITRIGSVYVLFNGVIGQGRRPRGKFYLLREIDSTLE